MSTRNTAHESTHILDNTNPVEEIKPISHGDANRLTTEPDPTRHHEGISERKSRSEHAPSRSIDVFDYGMSGHSTNITEAKKYSEDVADRNISSSTNHNPIERTVGLTAPHLMRGDRPWQQNKSADLNTRNVPSENPNSSFDFRNEKDSGLPLPKPKLVSSTSVRHPDSDKMQSQESQSEAHRHPVEQNNDSHGSATIGLENLTETLLHTHLAPAVTHETVQPVIHNVQSQKVSREIHNTDVIHRILPIKVVEVLPARHFIRSPSGTLNEVSSSSLQVLGADQK